MSEKKSWYDGRFYDVFIAPNQDKSFRTIKNIIPENSSVMDLGCGTGRLVFQLADHCSKATGVDVSLKNIHVAESKMKSGNFNNVSFIHSDFNQLSPSKPEKYDYAVFSYVLHEIFEMYRIPIIQNLKGFVNNIIISDYLVPVPKNFWGILTQAVEYFAGNEHYKNFKDYVRLGGLDYLVEKSGLSKTYEIKESSKTSHIVVLE